MTWPLTHGYIRVDCAAYIMGPFGIHKNINGIGWVISHAATGLCIPCSFDDEYDAAEVAELMRHEKSWQFDVMPDNTKPLRVLVDAAIEKAGVRCVRNEPWKRHHDKPDAARKRLVEAEDG